MTKEQFLDGVENWSNHRILLWEALERTKDSPHPVMEMGAGKGSTQFLRQYCKDNNRQFVSFESDKDYARDYGSIWIPDWDVMQWFYKKQYSVVLVDEAPGDHRKETLELFARHPIHFDIIVIHDSEPAGWNASNYQVRPLFDRFRCVYDLKSDVPEGAWATWLSNDYPF